MRITYHSWIAEQIDKTSETIDIDHLKTETISGLVDYLSDMCDVQKRVFAQEKNFYLSVNDQLEVNPDRILEDQDNIRIFPPLSGG